MKSTEHLELREYWDRIARRVPDGNHAMVKHAFFAGALGVRAIVERIGDADPQAGIRMLKALDEYLNAYVAEVEAGPAEPGEPTKRDRVAESDGVFDNELLPLMREVMAVCHKHGIAMLSAFELHRDPATGIVRLAQYLQPNSDGTVCEQLRDAWRAMTNGDPLGVLEAGDAPVVLH